MDDTQAEEEKRELCRELLALVMQGLSKQAFLQDKVCCILELSSLLDAASCKAASQQVTPA